MPTCNLSYPIILTAVIGMLPIIATATVGGDQYLEVLGYERSDQKVYLLRHYMDGRGRTPQLYYLNLRSATPHNLVAVDSIYRHTPKGNKDIDQDPVNSDFGRELAKIKARLVPLQPLPTQHIFLNTLEATQTPVIAWYDAYEGKPDAQKTRIPQYHYRYQLSSLDSETLASSCFRSSPQSAISYRPQLMVKQAFAIADQPYRLATIKYLADQFETGYYHDDAVLLPRRQVVFGTTLQKFIHCSW